MKVHKLAAILISAAFLAFPALADETSPNSAHNDQNTASTTMPRNQAGKVDPPSSGIDSNSDGSKAMLAPHTLMIRASLESAMTQVKGMKSQLDEVAFEEKMSTKHFKSYEASLKNDLSLANAHQRELKSSIRQFPGLAASEEFRNSDTSLNDMNSFAHSWATKASAASYWKNKDQAISDLNALESKLNNAINKTQSFGTVKLNLSQSVG